MVGGGGGERGDNRQVPKSASPILATLTMFKEGSWYLAVNPPPSQILHGDSGLQKFKH